jgi:hypothetical protein
MTLTAKELEFCQRYPATTDPVGLYLQVFHPGTPEGSEADCYDEMQGFMAREDIRLEIYVQQRFRQTYTLNHVVVELEQARQKALAEPVGAETAAQITATKAILLGLVTATPAYNRPLFHIEAESDRDQFMTYEEFLAAPAGKPIVH